MTSPPAPYSRFITTHDDSGRSIFSLSQPPAVPPVPFPNGAAFRLDYSTSTHPTSFSSDLSTYAADLARAGILTRSFSSIRGTCVWHVDTPPNTSTLSTTSPLHRTLTLDYGIVLEGAMELILDSGERRTMRRGDTVVQRGTMHAWRNLSSTEWVRMVFVIVPVEEKWEVGGEVMRDEYRAPLVVEGEEVKVPQNVG